MIVLNNRKEAPVSAVFDIVCTIRYGIEGQCVQIMEKKQNVGKGSGIQEKMAAVVTAFSRTT